MRAPALVLLLLAAVPVPTRALIYCVKPGGGSGCHATIPSALAIANDGDTIRIAAGTYAGNLVITENVTLEGGWNITFTERDPTSFITTILPLPLSTSSVVSIDGSDPNFAESEPTLDGLTIAAGRADLGDNYGGGLRIIDSNARVVGCTLSNNKGSRLGGGIWIQRGAPYFEDCRIEDNIVTGPGGSAGAGVAIEDGSATFVRCSIARNSVEPFGGLGGGISIRNLTSGNDQFLRIADSVIEDNSAGASGQGFGGAIAAQGLETPAPGTAGVFLDRVRIAGNIGTFAGGALSCEQAPFEVTNSVFVGNSGTEGNAIYATDFSSLAALSPGIVRNSTLLGSGTGLGIYTDARLEVVNSIISGNTYGIDYSGPPGELIATHNAFFANATNVLAAGAFTLDPTNLLLDPQLDATQHLLPGSPLIDAGRRTPGPFADVDGEPRPSAGPSGRFALDIGADEAPGEAQKVYAVDRGEHDLVIVGPGTAGSDAAIGTSVLGTDWSGDSKDDLMFFAGNWSTTGRGFGLLHLGQRLRGVLDLLLDTQEELLIQSELSQQRLGSVLASGDLDADGHLDVAVAAPGDTTALKPGVFVLSGGPTLLGTHTLSASSPADFALIAPDLDTSAFARRNALAIGDLSGDGIDDLVVGDFLADDGGVIDAGAVFVIRGHPALGGLRDLATTPADLTVYGPAAGAGLGRALALADLDADGDLDLAVSDAATTHLLFGPLAAGVRRLATAPADATIANLAGPGLAALDLSGEGKLDLVGGATSLRLVPGPFSAGQSLDAASAATLVLTGTGALASLAVADVLGDARAELIVGQTASPGLGGVAYAVSSGIRATGSVPIDQLASLAVVDTSGAADLLGTDVGAGDLDLDGKRDLFVTDPGAGPLETHPPGAQDAGRTYVFYGGAPVDNCPGLSNPDQADGDADGAGDACDRCPLFADPLQRDLGRVGTVTDPSGALSDGTGDACQCSDVSGDGKGNAADLFAIRAALTGASTLPAPQKCNVYGPLDPGPAAGTGLRKDCSLVDASVLARQLAGRSPGVSQVCATALGMP